MSAIPFEREEVLAQVKRIRSHRELFSKSANLQGFLEFLVLRRLSGDNNPDNYSGDVLAYDFFKRASSIGKVYGNKLRKRLQTYYETDGVDDPIVIQIPPGPYKPEIAPNAHRLPELSDEASELIWEANSLANTLETAPRADQIIERALAIHPLHPRLLGLRAKLYADAAFYTEFAGRPFFLKAARELVDAGRRSGVMPWEMLYVDGATEAILHWNWDAANRSLRLANAISPLGASRSL